MNNGRLNPSDPNVIPIQQPVQSEAGLSHKPGRGRLPGTFVGEISPADQARISKELQREIAAF